VHLTGRVLMLADDPLLVQRQLRGEDLDAGQPVPLRDNVSVDEIAPAWVCYYFGERLEDFPYLGLLCRGRFPVSEGALARGGFQVVVSGARHGCHGPREAALFAEYAAGIRLVLADSFDPAYRAQCDALGVLTSTDKGLLETLRRGQPIPLEPFLRGQEPLAEAIVRSGGLFGYTRSRLAGSAVLPVPARPARPMTLGEKILARSGLADLAGSVGLAAVAPGDGLLVRPAWRFTHESVTGLAAAMLRKCLPEPAPFHRPETILAFRDHLTFVDQLQNQDNSHFGLLETARRQQAFQESFCAARGIRLHGGGTEGEGISHLILAERYVLPGQVVAGSDSHTSQGGALGALALWMSAADLANAWVTGDIKVTVPVTCLVRLRGHLAADVSAKDLALHLLTLPEFKDGGGAGQLIEFQGEALERLGTDERATLTNMAPLLGAMAGIIAPDAETVRYIGERRGQVPALEPWMRSDPDAAFARVVELDCAGVRAMVAAPGSPGNAQLLDTLAREVPVDIAYVGSCAGGKLEDIRQAHAVVRWALDRGLALPLRVQLFVQMGSDEVRREAQAKGWVLDFEQAGARILSPGCGACIHAGPGVSTRPGQVTVAAFNRNYPGRSGPGPVWLASPATVAASAFAGRICGFPRLRSLAALSTTLGG